MFALPPAVSSVSLTVWIFLLLSENVASFGNVEGKPFLVQDA